MRGLELESLEIEIMFYRDAYSYRVVGVLRGIIYSPHILLTGLAYCTV